MRNTLSKDELEILPRGFKRIGHIATISLPHELAGHAHDIAKKIIEISGARTVALQEGPISGRHRSPKLRVISGDPVTETIHTENGCRFKIDAAQLMFSPGNLHERKRLIELVAHGEVVVDLFAGVGQFSVPIAVHARPSKVYAIEMNQLAYGYLLENIRMNRVGHIVSPILGDCAEVAPKNMADRVIMGILHVTHRYIPLALDALMPSGGVIHYHESVPSRLRFDRPIKRILDAAAGRRVEITSKRLVKRYAPGVDHVAIDAKIGPDKKSI